MTSDGEKSKATSKATKDEKGGKKASGGATDPSVASRTRAGSKTKKKTGGAARKRWTITVDQYNAMWKSYVEHQSVEKCAKAAGVKYNTARKYVTGTGEPGLGFVPIRERFLQAMAEAQQKQEQTLAEWQAEQLKDVKSVVGLHTAEFVVIQKDLNARMKKYEQDRLKHGDLVRPEMLITLDKLATSYDKMIRLAEHLLGASDMTIEHRDHDRFAGWTDQEKRDYVRLGIVPEHSR